MEKFFYWSFSVLSNFFYIIVYLTFDKSVYRIDISHYLIIQQFYYAIVYLIFVYSIEIAPY